MSAKLAGLFNVLMTTEIEGWFTISQRALSSLRARRRGWWLLGVGSPALAQRSRERSNLLAHLRFEIGGSLFKAGDLTGKLVVHARQSGEVLAHLEDWAEKRQVLEPFAKALHRSSTAGMDRPFISRLFAS